MGNSPPNQAVATCHYRMMYIMPEIGLATRDDIVGMLDLQEKNLLDRGGLLTV